MFIQIIHASIAMNFWWLIDFLKQQKDLTLMTNCIVQFAVTDLSNHRVDTKIVLRKSGDIELGS